MTIGKVRKYSFGLGVLILGLAILTSVFFRSSYLPVTQEKIILLASLFYFFWGVIHHLIRGDFHLRLLLEYLLIAAFAAGAGVLVLSHI